MVSINGDGNVNNNLFVSGGVKPHHIAGQEKVDVKIADNKHIGEFGEKLLEQVQPKFVQAAKIPETDRAELATMFAMAGIKNPKMPTIAQYRSVAAQVGTATTALDELTTTTNAENLFNSPDFGLLDNIFGIS